MEYEQKPQEHAEAKIAASGDLSAAIDALWARFLPEIRKRVELLKTAAAACAANNLSAQDRGEAVAAAHKLAGSLGTFNLTHGTELAREYEVLASRDETLNAKAAKRLATIASELGILVEGRK
jgi:HPt (histidine-containing phosphotransfer) domain-containing protein